MHTASAGTAAKDSSKAGVELVATLERQLGGERPVVVWVFAGPQHDFAALLGPFERSYPGIPVAMCTTAGEFSERGLTHGGASAFAVAGEDVAVVARSTTTTVAHVEQAVSELAKGFADALRDHARRGLAHCSTIVLVDGLGGFGEGLVDGLRKATRPYQQVIGGAAGDEAAFKATRVWLNAREVTPGAVAFHVFSRQALTVGLGTGLRSASQRMVVTRATGNVVEEIDGRPAVEAYERFAKERGRPFDRHAPGRFLIDHEIGLYFLDELRFARAPLTVRADGALVCAANVPSGSSIAILDGDAKGLVEAAENAGKEAKKGLVGECAGTLLFDCVCRGQLLGDAFKQEISAVRRAFGEVPMTGFLTYGEIARYHGRLQGWHNTTAVVLAFPK